MKRMIYAITLVGLTLIFYKCRQDAVIEETKVLPEELLVKRSAFNIFFSDLTNFSESLTSEQRTLLEKYVATKNSRPSAKEPPPPVCNCLPGQSSCSAEGTFNSCCICCPSGRATACGVTVGVASCKCEDPPPARVGGNSEVGPTDVEDIDLIKINPRGINDMLNFASQNEIDVSKIKQSLELLVNSSN